MKLAAALLALKGDEPLGFAIGLVTVVSPLTIQINGDPTDIVNPSTIGTGYTIGDTVLVLRPGASVVVVGTIN